MGIGFHHQKMILDGLAWICSLTWKFPSNSKVRGAVVWHVWYIHVIPVRSGRCYGLSRSHPQKVEANSTYTVTGWQKKVEI